MQLKVLRTLRQVAARPAVGWLGRTSVPGFVMASRAPFAMAVVSSSLVEPWWTPPARPFRTCPSP